MPDAFYFILRDSRGREIGQVEGSVKGGKFLFEVQTDWDTVQTNTFEVPIKIFKKGRTDGRISSNHAE